MALSTESAVRSPAIFLDKDGTLIKDVPYNVDPARIQVYPEAPEVLAELAARGYRLIVVSNQPGVAHGYFDEADVRHAEDVLREHFSQNGVQLPAFYHCPHHPEGKVKAYAVPCECRKPGTGLIERAVKDHNIDVMRSWMIGDILNDVEAGNRAGCRTILVDRGNETEWVTGEFRQPEWVVGNLRGALKYIVDLEAADEQSASAMSS